MQIVRDGIRWERWEKYCCCYSGLGRALLNLKRKFKLFCRSASYLYFEKNTITELEDGHIKITSFSNAWKSATLSFDAAMQSWSRTPPSRLAFVGHISVARKAV